MNEGPRRRRYREEPEPVKARGTFPLFPLFIVVILGGFGFGGLLFHLRNQNAVTTTTTAAAPAPAATGVPTESPPTSAPPTAAPTPAATPKPHASPHRIALTTPRPRPANKPSPTASVAPTPVPSVSPANKAPATPKPATPKPATPKPATHRPATAAPRPTPTPQLTGAAAAGELARSYLEDLMHGNRVAANTALGRAPDNNDFPELTMVDARSHITDVHTVPNGDGTYKVEIEVATPGNGTFFCTFQASRNEATLFLSDHYCVRVQ